MFLMLKTPPMHVLPPGLQGGSSQLRSLQRQGLPVPAQRQAGAGVHFLLAVECHPEKCGCVCRCVFGATPACAYSCQSLVPCMNCSHDISACAGEYQL